MLQHVTPKNSLHAVAKFRRAYCISQCYVPRLRSLFQLKARVLVSQPPQFTTEILTVGCNTLILLKTFG